MLSMRLAGLVAIVTSCTPYDPDLGAEPFLCGEREPRCPDGYQCVVRVGEQVCRRDADLADAGGDGNLLCSADNSREPNESIAAPTVVPIPQAGEQHAVDAVICPQADIDVYQLNVDTTGKNLRIEVNYESQIGTLGVALLNSTGVLIRSATQTNNDPDKLRADFLNVAQGTYYGRVQGTGMLNNYAIAFTVTSSTLPP